MKPLFTVVIPAYNRGALLARTLDSVAAQTEQDFEVVVVDDGSTDDTAAVAETHPLRPRVVRQANAGPGAARNRGADEARGDYLAFLDSDDLWFPWTLSTYRRIIERDPSVCFMTSEPIEFQCPSELEGRSCEDLKISRFDDYLSAGGRFRFAASGTTVIRRDAFLRRGGFTPLIRVAEDLDFAVRLGTERNYVFIERPAVIAYRQHSGNTHSDLDRMIEGISFLISQESCGNYPGGRARRAERRTILTRFSRSASITAVRNGRLWPGCRFYIQTLFWNLALGRWKYLAGFPALAAATFARAQPAGVSIEPQSITSSRSLASTIGERT